MNKQFRRHHFCAATLALTLLFSGSSLALTPNLFLTFVPAQFISATVAAAASAATESSKEACLGCHGPFEKVMAATADYMMESGEQKIRSNPHRYVPHDTKDIPECVYCHDPHPATLNSKEGLPKTKANWCYGCHHKKVLDCKSCH